MSARQLVVAARRTFVVQLVVSRMRQVPGVEVLLVAQLGRATAEQRVLSLTEWQLEALELALALRLARVQVRVCRRT